MGDGVGTDQAAVLNSTATVGSTEKVIFEQKPEGAGVNPPDTREQHPKQTGKSQCKIPTTGSCLKCVKGSKASGNEAEGLKGKGNEVREVMRWEIYRLL